MKKIYFLLMLAALSATAVLHAAEAGEDDFTTLSFTCSTASTLTSQMTEQMTEQVESLKITGLLRPEDFKTIDKCSRLKWLDLTETNGGHWVENGREGVMTVNVVENSLRHTAIETLYLSKNTEDFHFKALSLFRWDKDCGRTAADEGEADYDGQPHFDKTITVYVTGQFPHLFNPEPIDGYYGCPMEFHVTEGNDQCIEENGNIYGLDYTLEPFVEYKKGRLLKAGNLYGKTPEECTFDVRCIGRHAFTYTLWSYEHQVVTFSGHLNNIETRAFTYPSVPYEPRQEGEVTTKNVGAIRLQGWVPPACGFVIQDGMYHLDEPMSVKDFIPCKIIVPNKSRWYIGGTIWVPYIIDDYDYGLLCGTMTPDDREAYYSKQDQYAPRVEEIFEKYEKIYNSSDWSVTAGIEANGRTFYDESAYHPRLRVFVPYITKVPLSFTNPESGTKEDLNFSFSGTDIRAEVTGYDTDGTELFKDTISGNGWDYILDRPWPKAIPIGTLDEWPEINGEWRSPVPNGRIVIRLIPSMYLSWFPNTIAKFEKDLYFYVHLWTEVKPIELQQADDAPYYDLQGRPVTTPTQGLYIKSGKKVLIK